MLGIRLPGKGTSMRCSTRDLVSPKSSWGSLKISYLFTFGGKILRIENGLRIRYQANSRCRRHTVILEHMVSMLNIAFDER